LPILIILVGLPGSGKTTCAKEQKAKYPNRFVHVSRDEIRKIVNRPYREDRANLEKEERNQQIMQAIEAGKDFIIDETNLFESQRNSELKKAKEYRKIV